MTKIVKLIATPLLVLSMSTAIFASSPSIAISNEKLPINAVSEKGRVLVPLRAIFESLGARVDYDSATKTITGHQDGKVIILRIDDKVATIDGKKVKLDVPASIIKGSTLVPVRFIGESLGAKVDWHNNTVLINSDPDAVHTPIKPNKSISERQKEALGMAQEYAEVPGVSKKLLYNMLIDSDFDSFTEAEAQYAIDHMKSDWKANALRTAGKYVEAGKSKNYIYARLIDDGHFFTEAEAQYAVDHVKSDWKANALGIAQEYADDGMSKKMIYGILVSETGDMFSEAEAQYAIDYVKADWKANALKTAERYADDNMTKSQISDRLVSKNWGWFTEAEAQYAMEHLE